MGVLGGGEGYWTLGGGGKEETSLHEHMVRCGGGGMADSRLSRFEDRTGGRGEGGGGMRWACAWWAAPCARELRRRGRRHDERKQAA
jgi:hypothetical protein